MQVFILAAGLFAAAVLSLTRSLPLQNAVTILGGLAAGELALDNLFFAIGSPTRNCLLWPALVVLARALWRWKLRRPRADWNYGLWLILLASASVALAQLAF